MVAPSYLLHHPAHGFRKNLLIYLPVQSGGQQMKKAGFSGTVRLASYFRDALDKTYASKRFELNVEKAMNVRD
jgi:hypothetical protein